jgi:hypothetical protein
MLGPLYHTIYSPQGINLRPQKVTTKNIKKNTENQMKMLKYKLKLCYSETLCGRKSGISQMKITDEDHIGKGRKIEKKKYKEKMIMMISVQWSL